MKKFLKFVLIVILLLGGAYTAKKVIHNIREKNRIAEIKKGWHIEILTDYVNVRDFPDQYDGKALGKALKGEVYKVLDINLEDPNHYWYKIEYDHGKAWIAQNTSGTYLKDIGNETDIAIPIIKFKDDVYKVISIDDINYKHLIVWDDKDDYKITHIIYHEVDESKNINQYWIKYTITDKSGKSSSKTQKIEFENKPDESLVEDWINYTRD